MPFTAGASGSATGASSPTTCLGAGTWSVTFCLLGYIFWRSFEQVASIAGRGTLAFAVLLGLVVGGYQAFKRLRDPVKRRAFAAWVDRQAQRPLLRPVAWIARGVWLVIRPIWRYVLLPALDADRSALRFLIARLTPGGLGIELTTLLAIVAVGVYLVVLQVNLLETDSLLPGDNTALTIARDIESGWLTWIAKALGVFGSLTFVFIAALAGCGYLLARRRSAEALALAAGLAISEITMQVLKRTVERPRPLDPLVDVSSFSYPSGQATLSVTFLALAVVLSRTAPAVWRVALAIGGALLAVAIGLSRVYLRVHYLSDVGGGWALGLAAFSLCAAVASRSATLRSQSAAWAAARSRGRAYSRS